MFGTYTSTKMNKHLMWGVGQINCWNRLSEIGFL